ncbi:TIGR03643 family protein [uncultured Psychroserpens sp.]|uniref:TIGR03643 family protein n=1 Tax=uncultured Psychroserpens sp. TaxID=255436 RepID=UPI00262B36E5|nr:TIGR03643 family protein [uncultured Psychroserpens sp.]
MIFKDKNELDIRAIDRVIEMAWEDRTSFEAIEFQFGLKEQEVIELMRREMKPKSFKMWRKRVQGRKTKHEKLRTFSEGRFKCSRQKQITQNSISK